MGTVLDMLFVEELKKRLQTVTAIPAPQQNAFSHVFLRVLNLPNFEPGQHRPP